MSTSFAEDSPYKESDVNKAIKVVRKYFKKNMKGCVLEDIQFDDGISLEYAAVYIEEFGTADEPEDLIVVTTNFRTTDRCTHEGLAANDEYKDWQLVLKRNDGGKWGIIETGDRIQ